VRELSPGGIERFQQRFLDSIAAAAASAALEPPPRAHLHPRTAAGPGDALDQTAQVENNQVSSTVAQGPLRDARFLLLCVNTRNLASLVHVDVSSITVDEYLFRNIYKEYRKVREEHEWSVSMMVPLRARKCAAAIWARLPPAPPMLGSIMSGLISCHAWDRARLYKIVSADFVRVSALVFKAHVVDQASKSKDAG
jgi:hypothetical protein